MMSIESASVVRQVEKLIKKRRCRRRVRVQLRRPTDFDSSLQKLFDLCQQVFTADCSVPSASDVEKLSNILDDMEPEDVGLPKDLKFSTPRVTSTTIYKCDNFELSIFFLPPNATIPLHNHPDMTVFSKLLSGTMHIKSYDWVTEDESINSHHLMSPSKSVRLAQLKENRTFTAPSNVSVLYPTSGGNIHEFTAITPCAMLDVIGPPYSKESGRDCSFYKDVPLNALSSISTQVDEVEDDNCYSWLEEIETPVESEMDSIDYEGPQVVNNSSSYPSFSS